jgi:hypothetical protein
VAGERTRRLERNEAARFYLRAHHWSNRAYEGYGELKREAVRSLCNVCGDAENLKSVCNADYVRRRA